MSNGVKYERREHLAVLSLDRPATLNAIDLNLLEAMRDYLAQAETDGDIVAIAITGIGRSFCSGLDMSLLSSYADAGEAPGSVTVDGTIVQPLFGYLREISKPIIAAINGIAAGGGFVLAMMADLRFASPSAKFTTVFAKRGLVAEHATSWMLPRMIGTGRALDLLFSARTIDAVEAHRIGFVDYLTEESGLIEAVENYTAQLAATVSRRAMADIKAQVYRDLSMDFDRGWALSHGQMYSSIGHPDVKEGALSFIERRPPKFSRWTGNKK